MERIKNRVSCYWSKRSGAFLVQRLNEFDSEKKERWTAEIEKYLPEGRPLRILDIGTGTGFFACLLTSKGHQVTGVDLSPDMIKGADQMADSLGMEIDFQVMDAENLEFENESFDALVTRNVTWTLPHAEKAYREWYRVLKKGGVFINFDADYCRAAETDMDEELPENHAHKLVPEALKSENDLITMELSAYQEPRPQWDVQLLVEAGFEKISVDMGVYRRIYDRIDEFYNPVPIFAIAACK